MLYLLDGNQYVLMMYTNVAFLQLQESNEPLTNIHALVQKLHFHGTRLHGTQAHRLVLFANNLECSYASNFLRNN